jgi:hypothetical protein
MLEVRHTGWRGHDGQQQSFAAPKGNSLMWFDSIAGKDGLASTAGPSVLGPGQPLPAGRAVAVVLGYWYAGDGGGGLFFWDASSDATPDGGTVFAISCYPLGRWIRLAEGPVSVKWFGARVDGKHNDREAVQAALNTGPGVVLIPAGICAIYDAPLSRRRNAWIRGSRSMVCRAVHAAAAHARATSRETIGAAGVRGVEANCALMPLTQRRQRSVSW